MDLGMSVSDKIKGLFWTSSDAIADAPEARDDAAADEPRAAAPTHATATAPAAAPATEPDFAAMYASTGAADDPRVDQVLTAFEAMRASIPGPQLAVAVAATAHAIGVAPAAVTDTLARRLTALDAAVGDARRGADERARTRAAELEAATTKVAAEIAAMEQRIAALRTQLASVTDAVREHDQRARAAVAAFEERARAEAARLTALRDFLAHA
jgi:hypothetical protein